jgi:hypothetical protein
MADLLIQRHARISADGKLRHTLWRRWGPGRHVCFIGHNPSTADTWIEDPTTRRWQHFARAWGFDAYVAVNLYPIRTADPREAARWADWERAGPDWGIRDDIDHNLRILVHEAKSAHLVVACWGAIAADEGWIDHVVEEITTGPAPWPSIHAFGFTNSGAPTHPMARGRNRVPDDARPILWKHGTGSDA